MKEIDLNVLAVEAPAVITWLIFRALESYVLWQVTYYTAIGDCLILT